MAKAQGRHCLHDAHAQALDDVTGVASLCTFRQLVSHGEYGLLRCHIAPLGLGRSIIMDMVSTCFGFAGATLMKTAAITNRCSGNLCGKSVFFLFGALFCKSRFFVPCAAGRPKKKNTGRVFFFAPCAAGRPKKKHGARFFFCSVRGGPTNKKKTRGAFSSLFRARRANQPKKTRGALFLLRARRARFFFVPCAAGQPTKKNTGRVLFAPCAAGQPKKKNGARFFCLLRAQRANQPKKKHGARFFCSVRGGPTKKKKKRGAFFFAPCTAGQTNKKNTRGAVFFLLRARRGTFTHSLARPGARFFFLLRARWGKFTHSLARPRLCVVGTEGAFFFLLRARRGKFTSSLARLRLCVVEKAGAFFFFAPCAARGNSLTHWRIRGRVVFCSVRGGGNSLTHWRVHGCVWFFFVVCAAGEIHSLTRASGGAFFLFAVCAAVDIHSLTGASGGDSLTHWRVRGRVFFFAPCAVGEIHSLTGASAAVCGWNRGRFFFFASCAAGQAKKNNTGARFFFVRHAAGRAKKNFFLERAEQKKKHIFPICVRTRHGVTSPNLRSGLQTLHGARSLQRRDVVCHLGADALPGM